MLEGEHPQEASTNGQAAGPKAANGGPSPAPPTGPSLYPFRFSVLKEGDFDPTLGKRVEWLIDSDDEFIVYLDSDLYVEWNMNDNAVLDGAEANEALNQVAQLEAIDVGLDPEQCAMYRRMIAEGVARLFQKNVAAAKAAFDAAQRWIDARNREIARRWYVTGASMVAAPVACAVGALALWNDAIKGSVGDVLYRVAFCCAMGVLGAWLSVIQRSRAAELDPAAGWRLHYLESAIRVVAGGLGALLIALGLRAKLIPPLEGTTLSGWLLACMIAGTSERLVPSFIEQIEPHVAKPAATPR